MKKYKGKSVYDQEMEQLRENYKQWKISNKANKATFFMVYSDFKNLHLADISGGALKLYIYLGFHSNNMTGESWHSSESIAEFFKNDQRTIKKWFAELEERKLIYRIQTGYKRIANTFLIPYTEEQEEE